MVTNHLVATLPVMDAMHSPSDREAFEALVLRHQAAICAVAYAVLRDRARSEEVAQDALLIAWRDRATTPITAGWICGITRNLARNAARRRKEVVMEHEPVTQDRDARDALIAHESAANANTALAALADKYREAITLYYRSDESYADVAAALRISEPAARQRVHRARTRLRDRLAIVEGTLRATRPGPAFTAAVVAAWAIGKPASASASATASAARRAPWLVPAVSVAALVSTVGTGVALRAATHDDDPAESRGRTTAVDRRTQLTARFPAMAHAPATPKLPPGFVAVKSGTAALPSHPQLVDVDFAQAPVDAIMIITGEALDTPIWSQLDPQTPIHIKATQVPAIDVLDDALGQVNATRTEVAAIRIVADGQTDAAQLGGWPMSLDVHDAPLDDVLEQIEPRLAMPIGRLGEDSVHVTLQLDDQPAGVVLQHALAQSGYSYELTTGFVITAR